MSSTRKKYNNRIEWLNEQGQPHRLDGPAVEYNNGNKYWYLNGELHREDGPAVEYNNDIKSWWVNGKYYSEQDYKKEIIKIKLKRIKNL